MPRISCTSALRGLGFLQSADAVGAICMAMLLTHLPPMRRAGVTLLWAVAGFGLATIIFGLSQWFWLSLVMMFLVGALDNISVVVRHTLVQMLTPDEMRGRVSAVNGVFIVASNDLGGLESGLTAWLFGPVISVVGGGVGTILVVLAAMRLWPQILSIGSLDAIRPARRRTVARVTPVARVRRLTALDPAGRNPYPSACHATPDCATALVFVGFLASRPGLRERTRPRQPFTRPRDTRPPQRPDHRRTHHPKGGALRRRSGRRPDSH